MRCPSCGANVNGAFCEYCGTKMPNEQVVTQTINAKSVVVNNYYQADSAGQASHPHEQQVFMNVPAVSPKSKLVAFILWFFLGYFGAHRFYIGSYGLAVVYLFTFGLLGIGWLVDLVLLLLDKLTDRNGLPVSSWQ